MELCVDAGSEKTESCDDDAEDAIEGSYGPHACGRGRLNRSRPDCIPVKLILARLCEMFDVPSR